MGLANSVALRLAGITAKTPDPPGGTVVRDAQGNPTGALKDAATEYIDNQSLGSKEHFLRYAGRYVMRPPIAQRRIIGISKQEIKFWAKDRRLRRQVKVRLTPKEFLAA
jgi:predicted amidohydrolase YtcJ